MKRNLKLASLLLVLIIAISSVCIVSVFANDTEIDVGYYTSQSSARKETAAANPDGSYTLKSECYSSGGTVTLADGTVVNKEFYGWFTDDGEFYAPGETVTFTKSTNLYQAYGVTVYNFADLAHVFTQGTYVKLGCDIEGNAALTTYQCTSILDLNGHNYTVTNESAATWGTELGVFGATRGSYAIMGTGTITQNPRTKDNNGHHFASFATHGWGDENNPQDFWIGKHVTINTPYTLLVLTNQPKTGMPDMNLAGTINALRLLNGPSMMEGTIDIYESAKITLSGTEAITITNTSANSSKYLYITVHGGEIVMTDANARFITDNMIATCEFDFRAGSFAISSYDAEIVTSYLDDSLMLNQSVNNDVTYYNIVKSDCNHDYVLDTVNTVPPTKTETGVDVFNCSLCGKTKSVVTVYTPANETVTIKVKTDDGVKEVNVRFGDIAIIQTAGVGASTSHNLMGIKGTEEYALESIVSISVPFGISKIGISSSNSTLEELVIMDGADLEIPTFSNFSALKTVNIGQAKVKFNSGCANNVIEAIISEKSGAEVTFAGSAFKSKSSLKYLTMANGSKYDFGTDSFHSTGIENLVFPDEATVSFSGAAAFYNSKVKYAYFGKSITNISNKPLDCANNLEVVVIANATYVNEYCFCVANTNNATSVLKVYCHSENISLHQNTFVNRNKYGVEFYTIDPDITSIAGCKYTVFNGIPHQYIPAVVKEPTCIETGIMGYTVDCACGQVVETVYTVYTSEGSEEFSTAQSEIPLSDVHVLGTTLAGVNYKDGYLSVGTKEYYCALCNTAKVEESEPSAKALFRSLGYSVCTFKKSNAITQGYAVNTDAYNEYIALTPSFSYGVVMAGNQTGEAMSPLTVYNGNVAGINEKVYFFKLNTNPFNYFNITVHGITEEMQDSYIVMCAYVFDGETIRYLDNGTTVDSLTGVTYSSLTSNQ